MTAPGTPKASPAAVAAVQEALVKAMRDHHQTGSVTCACGGWWSPLHQIENAAVAAADAAAPHNAATALREAADSAAKEGGATVTHGYVAGWLRERADRIEANL